MREFDEKSITQAVIGRLSECDDPRFKRLMTSLITHLHDFVREMKLTEPEWHAAIQFLTDVGKICTDQRQADVLSGSHRWARGTHAAQDGAPSVSTRPHPYDRLGAGTLTGDHAFVRCREPIPGFRCRVRNERVAGGAIRPAPARSRPQRRAHGYAVLHRELRLPVETTSVASTAVVVVRDV